MQGLEIYVLYSFLGLLTGAYCQLRKMTWLYFGLLAAVSPFAALFAGFFVFQGLAIFDLVLHSMGGGLNKRESASVLVALACVFYAYFSPIKRDFEEAS